MMFLNAACCHIVARIINDWKGIGGICNPLVSFGRFSSVPRFAEEDFRRKIVDELVEEGDQEESDY